MTPPDERLTKIETTLWGAYGTNGLNSDVKRHNQQIGDLFGRDETMRQEIDERLNSLSDRVDSGFTGLYKLFISVMASVLVSTIGIIVTLVLTRGG